jgi:hypothetical protein
VGVLLAAAGYALFAALRHHRFGSSYDLALFDQAVSHYSRFESPKTTLVFEYLPDEDRWAPLPHLLGDHFHPMARPSPHAD